VFVDVIEVSPNTTALMAMLCHAALAALQHIAKSASANDLRGSRELFVDTAKRVVTGADERIWPAAAPAAIALVVAVEGAETTPV